MNCHTGVLTKTMEVGICIFGGHFSLLHYQGAIIQLAAVAFVSEIKAVPAQLGEDLRARSLWILWGDEWPGQWWEGVRVDGEKQKNSWEGQNLSAVDGTYVRRRNLY